MSFSFLSFDPAGKVFVEVSLVGQKFINTHYLRLNPRVSVDFISHWTHLSQHQSRLSIHVAHFCTAECAPHSVPALETSSSTTTPLLSFSSLLKIGFDQGMSVPNGTTQPFHIFCGTVYARPFPTNVTNDQVHRHGQFHRINRAVRTTSRTAMGCRALSAWSSRSSCCSDTTARNIAKNARLQRSTMPRYRLKSTQT